MTIVSFAELSQTKFPKSSFTLTIKNLDDFAIMTSNPMLGIFLSFYCGNGMKEP